MEIKLAVVTLLAVSSITKAGLVDLTPGGVNHLPPQLLLALNEQTFFDQAGHGVFGGIGYVNGWINCCGALNGAEWFETDLFAPGDHPFATISWNLAGQQDGFWPTLILVEGDSGSHMYRVSENELLAGQGTVTINGTGPIRGIAIYGTNRIPDVGTTLLLFGLALVPLMYSQKITKRL
jgi:hypothetical protein